MKLESDLDEFYDDYEEDQQPQDLDLGIISDAEILANDENFLSSFTGDLGQFVSECIFNFFCNKEMHYGGPIPPKMMLTDNYIKLVASSNTCNDIDRAYALLAKTGINTEAENENLVSDDVRLILQVLDQCVAARVPKCFRGGIILMYLELCEGIELNS